MGEGNYKILAILLNFVSWQNIKCLKNLETMQL